MKIGIIGCGLIGEKRALSAKALDLDLISAADINIDRARGICSRFGGTPHSDYRNVLSSPIDIVIIAVTHDKLTTIAQEALKAGKHVLLEKPGGRNAAELESVATISKITNLKVKVGFNHRFHPALLKARELVDLGLLGHLLYIRGRYGHGGRIGYEKEWRFIPEISGGGELLDQGSHLIDLSRWFLGDFNQVTGYMPRYYWPGNVEDNCFMLLKTSIGTCAHLHATWTEWKNLFSFEITGRNGKISIDGLGGSYGIEQLAFYKMLETMGPPETTIWQYPFADSSWEKDTYELVSAIKDNRSPLGNIYDAIENLKIIDKLYSI